MGRAQTQSSLWGVEMTGDDEGEAGGKGGGEEGGGAGTLGLDRHRLRGRNCLHCADSPADVSALPRNLFPREFSGWVTFH